MFHVKQAQPTFPGRTARTSASSKSSTPARPVMRSIANRAIAQLFGDQHRVGQRAARSSAACASASSSCWRRSSASSSPLGSSCARSLDNVPGKFAKPIPVTADTGKPRALGRAQIGLGRDPDQLAMVGRLVGGPSQSSRSARSASLRARSMPIASTTSLGVAQPGRVDQHERHAVDRQRHLDDVAGGPGDVGDDGLLALRQGIDQARFSGIGRTGDDDPDPVAQRLDARRVRASSAISAGQRSRFAGSRSASAARLPRRHNRSPPRPAPTSSSSRSRQSSSRCRKPPPARAMRRAALQLGFGGQQVGQALRLGQVDPAVGQGAPGEFARLGQPNARSASSAAISASTVARPPWH